ncbi:MAG: PTS system mannose/fructose/sorbose family transporter subunit IID [Atopobiaceae bacterium]|jgi:PTS system mannose-specific IID component|nr:PTS system mannose/fructose/sorbose family transporter subunit IID [Atopobiaceae bacterium]MCH4180453.1 PTS system mannose/fructose/sorbose family transporter subunit IID [Atopobiaceae bacterium]MCH4214592.1 PTS system mannose/fructose/sorbose family transporter subunit IID [Atopobiaceae bacterium]MCH4275813.1 PTS system mannose/fructose/sorbose family transporter subunit IID [Atopobiaceae bacterium]MCI1225823.1 PTS system mannose/fructose/sorbose family transporter subunit IID [Atopobiaceae
MAKTDTEVIPDDGKLHLTKQDRIHVWWRTQFLQGNWNYERMQNLGWCYAMIPAMKKLYSDPEDQKAFLKRHLEFFNTHPYVAAPVFGVELALEEEKANGADIDDAAIQGVKIGMMGPLAGVGDPVFWGTLRPVLGAFAASLALAGNYLGPILFFVIWNVIRMAFLWYTQELGYQQGSNITKDLSGGLMQKITTGASILGMFIMGVLIPRWTSIDLSKIVFSSADMGAVSDKWPAVDQLVELLNGGNVSADTLQSGLSAYTTIAGKGYSIQMVDGVSHFFNTVTLQSMFDQLLPGLMPLVLTLLCIWLLRKKVNPITIIFGLFAVGILGALAGLF